MKRKHSGNSGLLWSIAAALLISTPFVAVGGAHAADEDGGKTFKEQASEYAEQAREGADNIRMHATLEAKLAKSEHLSALQINTDVKDGVAYLEGQVETQAQRDLAEELALSVEGIEKVENDLTVTNGEPTLAQRLMDGAGDAAITAAVKSRLLVSPNTSGLSISVQTQDDVVTLSGEVETDEERELAELIASNTIGVKAVDNRLEVEGS